ncbi:hypothetical protein P3T36_002514 [Kitasatospora sp. MAP12-15]|uniref:hypothetical protein n=1 Tax=unclassified Kitasatospora TaxID=2633591 RepID=UPI002474B961|nr:hypothetical protein [Kitasatospora sp. MAP12-44]MDH6112796.1 hypothetical protein [Kitasatospora sp. MAP12-44]
MGNPPVQWVRYQPPPKRERTPRGRRLILLVLGCGLVLTAVGWLAWAEVAMLASGCGSNDPTDPMDYSAVAISNDTAVPVVVDGCSGLYCDAPSTPVTLQPGQQDQVHAACGASGRDMTSWRVTTTTGTSLGYIAVDTPRSTSNLIFPVSAAQPSRDTAASPTR